MNAHPANNIICLAIQKSPEWKAFIQSSLRPEIVALRDANVAQSTAVQKSKFAWATSFLKGGSEVQMVNMHITNLSVMDFNASSEDLANQIVNYFNNNQNQIMGF